MIPIDCNWFKSVLTILMNWNEPEHIFKNVCLGQVSVKWELTLSQVWFRWLNDINSTNRSIRIDL